MKHGVNNGDESLLEANLYHGVEHDFVCPGPRLPLMHVVCLLKNKWKGFVFKVDVFIIKIDNYGQSHYHR